MDEIKPQVTALQWTLTEIQSESQRANPDWRHIYMMVTAAIEDVKKQPDVEAVLKWDTLVEFYQGDLVSAGRMMEMAIAVQHKKLAIVPAAQAYVDQIEEEHAHPAHDPETHQEYALTSNRLWEALVRARHDNG